MKMSFFNLLFVLFLALKLMNFIAWPWLWVAAPLWIPLVLTVSFFAFLGAAVLIGTLNDKSKALNAKKS